MEKVPEDPEFRSVFCIFPERNPGMCSRKFPEQVPETGKFPECVLKTGKYFESCVMYIVIPTAHQVFKLNYLCRSRTHIIYNTKEIK